MSAHWQRHSVIATLLWGLSQLALADGVTIAGNLDINIGSFINSAPQPVSPAETLGFSADLLNALTLSQIQIAPSGQGSISTIVAGSGPSESSQPIVSGLSFDPITNVVYASLIGANGAGSISSLPILGLTSVTPQNYTVTASGLTLSGAARDALIQSLGLSLLTLSDVPNVGVLPIHINLPTESLALAVPEPGTSALMGLGLFGLALTARRRSQAKG